MSIDDLIANKIVGIGVEEATEFNRTVFFDELEDVFDENIMKHIKAFPDKVCEAINRDERVAEVVYDADENNFDMVFYWQYCLDKEALDVLYVAKDMDIELEYEQVVEIGHSIINDYDYGDYNNFILEKINEIKKDKEEAYER